MILFIEQNVRLEKVSKLQLLSIVVMDYVTTLSKAKSKMAIRFKPGCELSLFVPNSNDVDAGTRSKAATRNIPRWLYRVVYWLPQNVE